jgi:hypothetical protein
MSVSEIQESVSRLPEKKRAELAAWILSSLPTSSQEDSLAESLAIAEARRTEVDSGKAHLVEEKAFWNGVEHERKQWK